MTLAIETTGFSKSFGPVHAIDSVSLSVGPGEIYGFLGLNGAGKTTTLFVFMLMPFVAFFASAGCGYLAPMGWAFLTLALAQVSAVLGWGDWFPWAVPAIFTMVDGPNAQGLGIHSYVLLTLTFVAGLAATLVWWRSADQTR